MSTTRRSVSAGLLGLSAFPGCARAEPLARPRLVLVILRGAMDGLHALAPVGDPDYARWRPDIALGGERPGISFGSGLVLHPALRPLMELRKAGELVFLPGVGSSYRGRSHFEAQNVLETAAGRPYDLRTGWLSRAVEAMGSNVGAPAIAVGATVPTVLQGRASVKLLAASRLPDAREDYLLRLESIYRNDPLFHEAFSEAQSEDTELRAASDSLTNRTPARETASTVAKLMATATGPQVAVLEMGGWDTHSGQLRRLNRQFGELADIIVGLRSGLGAAWSSTAVLVVSEFGRTVRQNGSGGTDHGTGGLAMLAGGALKTSATASKGVIGTWPDLAEANLFEGRDVRITTPLESVLLSIALGHLSLTEAEVRGKIFPAYRAYMPLENMFGM